LSRRRRPPTLLLSKLALERMSKKHDTCEHRTDDDDAAYVLNVAVIYKDSARCNQSIEVR
jgi:hypothetical protein